MKPEAKTAHGHAMPSRSCSQRSRLVTRALHRRRRLLFVSLQRLLRALSAGARERAGVGSPNRVPSGNCSAAPVIAQPATELAAAARSPQPPAAGGNTAGSRLPTQVPGEGGSASGRAPSALPTPEPRTNGHTAPGRRLRTRSEAAASRPSPLKLSCARQRGRALPASRLRRRRPLTPHGSAAGAGRGPLPPPGPRHRRALAKAHPLRAAEHSQKRPRSPLARPVSNVAQPAGERPPGAAAVRERRGTTAPGRRRCGSQTGPAAGPPRACWGL
ncbi:serine/arginine repetitive matrix protein 3-like [Pogoniulus pusillus]|uniref:serine/arginine repetitive matrix protein 3-like n=1 Tax=Pogoniulus pusillus TaxID=488313 RepID=UPI0030B9904D